MRAGGIAYLSWKHLSYRPLRTLTLVAAIALTIYLPLALYVFTSESTRILQERARSTPLLLGPKGSSLDLTLNALYFTSQELPSLKHLAYTKLAKERFGTTIPIHARFHAKEAPIIGTSLAYFDARTLPVAEGRMITRLGDCVIGARLARRNDLHPGDRITSSPENVFDLAGVYPLRMRITGILAANHTPDDDAVFADLKTTWVIEGLAHGHQDLANPTAADAVRKRKGNSIQANASVVEFNEVTENNIASFHFHGDPEHYPLSSVILIPKDKKSRALALGAYQGPSSSGQLVIPLDAVTQLTETLFATSKMTFAAFLLLGLTAFALAALVFLLSFRLREREMQTYAKIGARTASLVMLKSTEVAIVLISGIVLALLSAAITKSFSAGLLPQLLN
ncbi:MAG: ABC transporter permease [Akkermansiaceae bacterium]|jgi:putative ABC transport system permease protein